MASLVRICRQLTGRHVRPARVRLHAPCRGRGHARLSRIPRLPGGVWRGRGRNPVLARDAQLRVVRRGSLSQPAAGGRSARRRWRAAARRRSVRGARRERHGAAAAAWPCARRGNRQAARPEPSVLSRAGWPRRALTFSRLLLRLRLRSGAPLPGQRATAGFQGRLAAGLPGSRRFFTCVSPLDRQVAERIRAACANAVRALTRIAPRSHFARGAAANPAQVSFRLPLARLAVAVPPRLVASRHARGPDYRGRGHSQGHGVCHRGRPAHRDRHLHRHRAAAGVRGAGHLARAQRDHDHDHRHPGRRRAGDAVPDGDPGDCCRPWRRWR